MKLKITTLGCKVNQYESQAIAQTLLHAGIAQATQGQQADIVIINSCTVTATSDKKVRHLLRHEKKENPNAVMVLTGCMAQAFPEKATALLEADIILGTNNRRRLLPHILAFLSHRQRIIDISPHQEGAQFEQMEIDAFAGHTRAYIKIQDGCNRFCAYCIIPYARGQVRSKPLADLQSELTRLAQNGYREIVLTGINLSCYGQELGLSLCHAIEAACAIPGIDRVRLGSLEPEHLSPQVINRMAVQPKLCPQFHLSLQSGCNATLLRMNRHYTNNDYNAIVQNLRAAFPGAAITTDIMVGFPGETDAEFAHSLAFVQKIAFAQAHVFAYSRRPGTVAYHMQQQLPSPIKEARSKQMIAATLLSQRQYFETHVGKTLPVLFEHPKDKNLHQGHTETYIPVLVPSGANLHGQLLPVIIESAQAGFCIGRLSEL